MKKKARAFAARIRRGEIVKPIYLAYYYTYLTLYDRRYGTNFSNSQAPTEIGSEPIGGSTGNFPAHPRLVRRFLRDARISRDAAILDVGHGSGMVLHVAAGLGFTRLSGVEYGQVPYDLSVENVGDMATLMHGNALDVDLTPYTVLTFFSPFRGELAVEFFEKVPDNIEIALTINHDRIIEPVLEDLGFWMDWSYQHRIYENFNAKLWRRTAAG
jgi:hypothetical protein